MAVDSSDFVRFLYANYPDDYRKATASNVPEDVLTAIISRHASHYSIWNSIPEWVKDRYRDILPKEVLNGNIVVKEFIKQEEKNVKQEEKETAELLDFSVSLLALGYTAESVKTLGANRLLREQLLKAAKNGTLTDEQRAQWLLSRQSDRDTILQDWQTNQPEKYLVHLIKQMNRAEKRGQTNNPHLEQELAQVLPLLKDKGNRKKLVEYLREKPQQAALGHLSPEVLGKFSSILKDCGINITPTKGTKGQAIEVSRESLVESLKKHFQWRQKMEEIMKAQYGQKNADFSKLSVRDVLNDGLKKLIDFRSNGKKEQRA